MFGIDPVSALSYDLEQAILDIPVLSDSMPYNIEVGRSLSDTVAVSESLYRVRDILDTLVLSDSIRQVAALRDTIVLLEDLISSKTIKLKDTIVLNETIAKYMEAFRFPKDYIVFNERVNFAKTIHVSLQECIALLEAVYNTKTADFTDTISLTDALIRGIVDSLSLTELLEHNGIYSKCGTFYLADKGPGDTMVFSETLTIGISKRVSLTDSLVLYDTVIRLR